ncbi:MAG TPA: rifamycin-inactivating phosphotransferase, partial [Kofleriaceae bacterium]
MSYVVGFHDLAATQVAAVGGKGARLAALSRIAGVRVPPGFCVTTEAFDAALPALDDRLTPDALRAEIEATAIPPAVAAAITGALAELGEAAAYAVRSSATAEDLPTASFAGQHDSYLNIIGREAILAHVRRCWASLWTDRAVAYRRRNGFDPRKIRMAVVVQRMVTPHAAGVLFTADPLTGNRKTASIEATFGLGEALVSGLVTPDVYKVRAGAIVAKTLAGPTAALSDAQVVRLDALGRRIEAHFAAPQDIEWCLAGEDFQLVQSRAITTLFPLPAETDDKPHVYVSVGHQQMMTDAMKPLGLSVWRLSSPASMTEAGGRLFVEVTRALASPASRAIMVQKLGAADPLLGDALQSVIDRGFVPTTTEPAPTNPAFAAAPAELDPAVVSELIAAIDASVAAAKIEIETRRGPAAFDAILADVTEHSRRFLDPRNLPAIIAPMEAAAWLNEHLLAWLGEKRAADTLARSVPNNVTSEMGLALLQVADLIRPHAEVVAFLERVEREDFLADLPALAGGREARAAIEAFLARYGMRCAGEIDITRPRWSERPTLLLPMLLGNIKSSEPGAGARRFEQGLREAEAKERDVLARLRALPDGEAKAAQTRKMIDRLRAFAGYREYPKYGIVRRYFIYKQALLREADRLVEAGVLRDREDSFFLTFQELREAVETQRVDPALLRAREAAFRSHQLLAPPRVLTSEGDALAGAYRRDEVPAGALVGVPVSTGTVEGRARVILDLAHAELEPGDILVTTFTDPSWTPVFLAIVGLVTEVGGMMTHGAVIAREYGLPAVVGVTGATRRIRDGQRIRVHGT